MSHDHSSMSMGDSTTGTECQVSMLWNWNTVDACFISSSWQIKSNGMFAGSVIGIFLLCMAIEGVRRLGREYDRRLVAVAKAKIGVKTGRSTSPEGSASKGILPLPTASYEIMPTWIQQLLRGFIYGSQFTAAFLVMLLGMYYNGYILFAIFLGQTAGFILFGRDTAMIHNDANRGNCC